MHLTESALRSLIRNRLLADDPSRQVVSQQALSEGILYHLETGRPLRDNIYRWGSQGHLAMMREARQLLGEGLISVDADDRFLLEETEIGCSCEYEGREVPLDLPFEEDDDEFLDEADYHGKDVDLNQPTRSSGPSKFQVYTRNDKGKVIKLGFGSKGIDIKTHSPERVRSFLARHNCDNPGPRWKARWWSCNLHRYKKQLGLKFKGRW
jgi:hypothetical protein